MKKLILLVAICLIPLSAIEAKKKMPDEHRLL